MSDTEEELCVCSYPKTRTTVLENKNVCPDCGGRLMVSRGDVNAEDQSSGHETYENLARPVDAATSAVSRTPRSLPSIPVPVL